MQKLLAAVLFFLCYGSVVSFAQDLKTSIGDNKELDSLRKKEESGRDSVIFYSRYIRYTTRKLTKDSIPCIDT